MANRHNRFFLSPQPKTAAANTASIHRSRPRSPSKSKTRTKPSFIRKSQNHDQPRLHPSAHELSKSKKTHPSISRQHSTSNSTSISNSQTQREESHSGSNTFVRERAKYLRRHSSFNSIDHYDDDDSSSSSESETEYTSTVYSMTSIDSTIINNSWIEYKQNLKKLFYCFAGYQHKSKQNQRGIYMSRDEVERFLEIVSITKYWKVDQVFEIMHDNDDEKESRVTLNEFIQYFCNEDKNPTASDLKKHIEKQISWQLLLKSLTIFDKVDTDNSGELDKQEFKVFMNMFYLVLFM